MKVLPVVAEFVCVIVNVSFATVETYMLPLANSAAAFAVVAVRITLELAEIIPDCVGATTVVAALVVNVTVPTAFDLPAANCCSARMIFFRSVSLMLGVYAVKANHSSSDQARFLQQMSKLFRQECEPSSAGISRRA